MKEFDSKKAAETYLGFSNLIHGKSDRELLILGAAILDDILKKMLKLRIVPGSIDIDKEDSFAKKIRLARAVGIINKSSFDSLLIIAKMRNDFAHDYNKNEIHEDHFKNKIREIFRLNSNMIEALIYDCSDEMEKLGLKDDFDDYINDDRNKMRQILLFLIAGFSGVLSQIEQIESL
ncbi:hypothetical protein CE91St38_00620 [Desulfovibrionaceae bacterium]|nr:hypothetical protein CE91St38_00620 [Desulfovibrionaceae bacterium]GKI10608.1 hypothetical protein CE91St39_00620 [Desulfovibrionaceae bacterium]